MDHYLIRNIHISEEKLIGYAIGGQNLLYLLTGVCNSSCLTTNDRVAQCNYNVKKSLIKTILTGRCDSVNGIFTIVEINSNFVIY